MSDPFVIAKQISSFKIYMPQSDFEKDSYISKSQRKRDMTALQKLGEVLVGLSETQLKKIPLPEELAKAVIAARTLKSHEAKRRQLQYIGKLMRDIDAEPIEQAVKKLQLQNKEGKTHFHKIEYWRAKLIEEGDAALALFLKDYPNADHQSLRQLIRKAQKDKLLDKDLGNKTALFRFLSGIIK